MKDKSVRHGVRLNRSMGIYKITNTVTLDFYIGSSENLKRRKITHFSLMKNGAHRVNKINEHVKIYGVDCFKFEVLDICFNKNRLKLIESIYIKVLNPSYNKISPTCSPISGNTLCEVLILDICSETMFRLKRLASNKNITLKKLITESLEKTIRNNIPKEE